MKAYFSASRYYRDQNIDNYNKIVEMLKGNDCRILENTSRLFPKDSSKIEDRVNGYKKMLDMIDKADFSVFEASFPSTLHIGHEITLAIDKGKPVIVLYTKGSEPMLFRGIQNDKIVWVEYNLDNLEEKLAEAIVQVKNIQDVRFNFFVSPQILNFLDWVAKERRIPRSVFLRSLIEKEMKKEKEYK